MRLPETLGSALVLLHQLLPREDVVTTIVTQNLKASTAETSVSRENKRSSDISQIVEDNSTDSSANPSGTNFLLGTEVASCASYCETILPHYQYFCCNFIPPESISYSSKAFVNFCDIPYYSIFGSTECYSQRILSYPDRNCADGSTCTYAPPSCTIHYIWVNELCRMTAPSESGSIVRYSA